MKKNLINTDEISSLDELMPKNKQRHKVDIDKLLPEKFQPKTKRHFILMIDNVDAFLVSHINEMPEFKKNWFSKKLLRCKGDLKVTFNSPIAPSVIQQLAEKLNDNKKFDIQLKQLDPLGTVVAMQTFKNCKLDGFRITSPSYDSTELEKVLATFKCRNVSIDF